MPQNKIPKDLLEAIHEGRCVAFVGAGFSMPSVPNWPNLLKALIARLPDGERKAELAEWAGQEPLSARDYEGIGAAVEKDLGDGFRAALDSALGDRSKTAEQTKTRINWLKGIPFHQVLTTNFDELLGKGHTPGEESYARAIAAPRRSWWSEDFWGPRTDCLWSDRLIALHGQRSDAESLVFSTQAYRRRLFGDPAYKSFLRTLFATKSILYLGFSFTDAYVNELRSEILSIIGLDGEARRLKDYAILKDVSKPAASHLEEAEGLCTLTFDTTDAKGHRERDFTGFDKWLEAIHAECNPPAVLSRKITGKTILWFDPNPANNSHGTNLLAAETTDQVIEVSSVEEALSKLNTEPAIDLVISRWGHHPAGDSDAQRLLAKMERPGPPLIVFADSAYRESNRELALRSGAIAFTDSWSELFEVIDDRFSDTRARAVRQAALPDFQYHQWVRSKPVDP